MYHDFDDGDYPPLSFTPQDQANAVTVGLIVGVLSMLLSLWLDRGGFVLHVVMLYGGFLLALAAGYRLRQAAGGTKPFTGRRVGS